MDSASQSNPILRAQRPGDQQGHHQQSACLYEVLTVDEQCFLVARWPGLVLRFIALGDVVVPF